MAAFRKFALLILCIMFALLVIGCGASDMDTGEVEATIQEFIMPATAPSETLVSLPLPTEMPTELEPTEAEVMEIPSEPVPLKIAEQILACFEIQIDGINCNKKLADDSYWSKQYIKPGQSLSVDSEEPFSALYLEWDQLPGSYCVTWDGGRLESMNNGFLHEYLALPAPVNRVEFVFDTADNKVLCDVDLFTEGSVPDHVQVWMPSCEDADILVFPTHSDDDVLFFGPLMSYYAVERGLTVQTAFMVEHRGEPGRNHERLNGLWELGIRHYPILGTAPDTSEPELYYALRYYKDSNIEQWQVEQIRRFRPLVVVGHDIDGEYGNGGHKVNTHYLITAIEAAADEQMYPESAEIHGLWNTPKFYLHLYPENEIIMDVNSVMTADPLGRTPFQVAEDAFKCHVSQHHYGFHVQQGLWRANDCRPFGLYRSLVGFDQNPDIMENIVPSDWR